MGRQGFVNDLFYVFSSDASRHTVNNILISKLGFHNKYELDFLTVPTRIFTSVSHTLYHPCYGLCDRQPFLLSAKGSYMSLLKILMRKSI